MSVTTLFQVIASEGVHLTVDTLVHGQPVLAIIDTGAAKTIVNKGLYKELGICYNGESPIRLKGAFGGPTTDGYVPPDLSISIGGHEYSWGAIVADIEDDLLLGCDFLMHYK